ncbi:hypothetical protein LX97_02102 [Nonlabens dokdonensis]|jgi:hypothetical protein|uniref:Tetratricopeptide repeat protein n=2 Tax=Nonlabens dokdonensis TaxID=328515 RepID=L7WFM9_NONDD|nr:hypothetical protein [Nonlabens dokdonensis]AGC77718.1 hypothetical protein DDD_2591 [Nonlabens dokdonensis DSW-6]PZX39745.1 hypothetical protein LX97_02102 [Nonlabens dokdonensis]
MKNFKKVFFGLVIVISGYFIYTTYFEKYHEEPLTKDLKEIANVFDNNVKSNNVEYDLEKTIKTIHSLDNSRKNQKSFEEYYAFLKTFDYSDVAIDVLNAKKDILPIMNEMHQIDKELENAESMWTLFQNMPEVLIEENSKASSSITYPYNMIAVSSAAIASNVLNQHELSEKYEKQFNIVKNEYLDYVENYTKVYSKYLKQWDEVCIKRDKAYLEINSENFESALIELDKVLLLSPKDREALLLKSLCLIEINKSRLIVNESIPIEISEIEIILQQYLDLYPDQSAPALLLKGRYSLLLNKENEALTYFNQSAIEYPKQAHNLLDLLNTYEQRNYLNRSVEGKYLLELYKSTMEGYGAFSPNFQKALIASNKFNSDVAKEEILKHFFRRGNQLVYDFLISDMDYCEKNLKESFNLIFEEKSFLDLEANTSTWNSNALNISLNNKSDIKLQNVRLFLCIHFTDMYKDDYEVFKADHTINEVMPHSKTDFGKTEIKYNFLGKDKNIDNDIVSVRAIVVTDERIAWIDKNDFKLEVIKDDISNKNIESNKSKLEKLDLHYKYTGISGKQVLKLIDQKSILTVDHNLIGKDVITLKLPRELIHLNPYFSINKLNMDEAIIPEKIKLNGPYIEMQFDHNVSEDDKVEFYLNSSDLLINWSVRFDENRKVKTVETNIY